MTRILKTVFYVFFFLLIIIPFPARAEQTPPEQLKQLVADLQKSPDDNALREKIIKVVQEMKSQPAIPEEVRRHFVRGNTALKDAKDSTDYDRAIARYKDALLIAPWWADPYFNMAKALELRERYDDAIASLKLYLLAAPEAGDARTAQDMIYALEEKKEGTTVKETASKKVEEAQLLRDFNGSWRLAGPPDGWKYKFLVSGRELTIIEIAPPGNPVKEHVWSKGTLDGRNFEGSYPGCFGDCPTVWPHQLKGSLSKDGNSIQVSRILIPELAINETLRNAVKEFIQAGGQRRLDRTFIREPLK